MLYEVAMILKPTKKVREEGALESLVMEPTAVIAKNEQAAAVSAALQKKLTGVDMNQVEVLVRPFE